MSKGNNNHFTVLSIIIVGFFALVALTVYMSSKGALPPLTGINLDEVVNIVNSVSSTTMAASLASTTNGNIVIEAPLGNIDAEISDNEIAREKGLSGRTSLDAGRGMLFSFVIPSMHGFWMKDMNFPIDIVWIDATHRVVGINDNLQPSSYPNTFFPPKNISFVLEINAGAAKEFGIKVGDVLKFDLE